jgi:uncharacterized protein YjiS (DUF1127 family)
MSTISLGVMTDRRRGVSHRNKVILGLAEWRRHARSGHELMCLSDRCLQDIDMSRIAEMRRYTSDFEACKPFWMA